MDAETWQRLYGPPQPARRRPPRPRPRPARRKPARPRPRPVQRPPAPKTPPGPGSTGWYVRGTLVATFATGAEIVVLLLLHQMYLSTGESWALPVNYGMGLFFLILLSPLLLLLCVCLALGAAVLVEFAEWTAKRLRGRDAWWWMPLVAAVPCGLLVMAVALPFGAWRGGLWWWAGLTVFLTVPALTARWALRPEPRHPVYALALTTLGGVAAVVLTIVGGYAAFTTGLVETYQPPELTRETVVGAWSDGRGGTLRIAPDGTATATGLSHYEDETPAACDGTGSWRAAGGTLEVSIPGCGHVEWDALGTPEEPRLYAFIGDPDAWNLYELRRADN
ncbi:hypothetical protein [Streptomyces thermolilacinus]|uniref:hypothetical protein n=1 Tax=Streptomyces thermolilacinus TaxID=285540 RepID=UPI0034113B4E